MCGALSLFEKSSIRLCAYSVLKVIDARELALVVRVVGVEALGDELGVGLVLGEDDRLAEPVAARDLQAARHQVLQHLVDGVLVEQPLVDRRGLDPVGDVAVLVPLQRVPLVLLLLATARRT